MYRKKTLRINYRKNVLKLPLSFFHYRENIEKMYRKKPKEEIIEKMYRKKQKEEIISKNATLVFI